eukprot:CAMPEP_0170517976 /NCGR_PEP_ID=MMETSP0209-20121228/3778_1 /TAXON_ID=665100 ORGANISM="Litonotus pictus, Strain P1" /NCGR_SAMPLE_ID=MMETSP0209 /ASSEMBLY_ACC=CAM_ASM_000301 /LENGTH=173 /DNA_ID=CAMNT_0010803371 /DNA_START=551 /DNA_END=1069 /DNA_ORIENTATION=-
MAKILMGDEEITNAFEEESVQSVQINTVDPETQRLNTNSTNNNDNSNEGTQQDLITSNLSKSNNEEFKPEKEENPVLRSTFIHILGDIIQSVGVVIASSVIYFLQDSHPLIVRVDPFCTFVFGVIVLSTSIPVAKDCINVLMEAAPASVKQDKLLAEFKEIPEVVDFHDIHIW